MPTVFATQQPSRLEDGVWVPTMDLTPAKKFGELRIMLPSGLNFHASGQIMPKLKESLREFKDGDYFLPLGDPLIMAAASAFIGSRHRKFNMLKWDRFEHAYFNYEVEL